jgi:hypothetical protein
MRQVNINLMKDMISAFITVITVIIINSYKK